MSPIPRSLRALLLLGALGLPHATPTAAQSVADRTPNLSGGWVGTPRTIYFNFLHRFEATDAPARKVINFPTFLLGYAPVASLLVGAQYTTNSDLVASFPNEWEPFARWAAPAMGPVRLALTGAYNNAAESFDGEGGLTLKAAGSRCWARSGRSRRATAGTRASRWGAARCFPSAAASRSPAT